MRGERAPISLPGQSLEMLSVGEGPRWALAPDASRVNAIDKDLRVRLASSLAYLVESSSLDRSEEAVASLGRRLQSSACFALDVLSLLKARCRAFHECLRRCGADLRCYRASRKTLCGGRNSDFPRSWRCWRVVGSFSRAP